MKRDPVLYLADMQEFAEAARQFLDHVTFEDFTQDTKTKFAVFHALEMLAEASRRVPKEIVDRHPEIPWRQIIGMRNVLAHDYLGLKLDRIYETVRVFIPELLAKLPRLIDEVETLAGEG
ncbi:MAG: DUF86 domain-containing protein [Alphaproteobacteria bacterium]|nr:DUF86 domain-containing protein [Alphaproteobacteria bacterium]